MIGSIGPLEIGIVLVIALLVFGPKKLPDLGRSVGSGMRELKRDHQFPRARPRLRQLIR